jgi:hypothetical protein
VIGKANVNRTLTFYNIHIQHGRDSPPEMPMVTNLSSRSSPAGEVGAERPTFRSRHCATLTNSGANPQSLFALHFGTEYKPILPSLLATSKYLSPGNIYNGSSRCFSHSCGIPHGSTSRGGGRGTTRATARMLQLDAAGMSVRVDGYDVYRHELFPVRHHHSYYGADWERPAYDECTGHVDQCIWSVSFSFSINI